MSEHSNRTLEITPREGAATELIAIGREYWALTGFDVNERPEWRSSVKDIDTRGYSTSAHVIAAAAVRAELPGATCRACAGSLQLTSRTAYASVLMGDSSICVDCDQQLQDRIKQLMAPDELKQRKQREKKERQQRQQAYSEREQLWNYQRQNVLRSQYAEVMTPEVELPCGSVEAEVAALTLLRFSPAGFPIAAVEEWNSDIPMHPGSGKRRADIVHSARHEQLVQPHPKSPINAFTWDPVNFREACADADGDLSKVSTPELGDQYRPLQVRWYVPYGSTLQTAAERLDEHCTARLDPAAMPSYRQHALVDLAITTAVEEVERYFSHQLDYRQLPEVPDNHQPRLRQALEQGVSHRSLGTVYSLVWRSVKTAAATAHSRPRAPKANMTTYAVNHFEDDIQRSRVEPGFPNMSFGEPNSCPLSAFTRTLFHRVLELDPMTTVAGEIVDKLPPPLPDPAPQSDYQTTEEEALESSESPEFLHFASGIARWFALTGETPAALLHRAAERLEQLNLERPTCVESIHWKAGNSDTDGVLTVVCDLVRDYHMPQQLDGAEVDEE